MSTPTPADLFGTPEFKDENVEMQDVKPEGVPEGTPAISAKDTDGNVIVMPVSEYAEWERGQDELRARR